MSLLARTRRLYGRYREIVAYLFVGGLTFLVSYGSFSLFYNLLGFSHNKANALSIVLAVLFAYVTNKFFVFRSRLPDKKALLQEMLSFFAARGITMLFEFGAMALLCDILFVNPNLAKLVVTFAVVLLNYVFSKLLVFRKKT